MSEYRQALERLNVRRTAVIEAIAVFERLLAGREPVNDSSKPKVRRQTQEIVKKANKGGRARKDPSRTQNIT